MDPTEPSARQKRISSTCISAMHAAAPCASPPAAAHPAVSSPRAAHCVPKTRQDSLQSNQHLTTNIRLFFFSSFFFFPLSFLFFSFFLFLCPGGKKVNINMGKGSVSAGLDDYVYDGKGDYDDEYDFM